MAEALLLIHRMGARGRGGRDMDRDFTKEEVCSVPEESTHGVLFCLLSSPGIDYVNFTWPQTRSNPPASASQSTGTVGVSHQKTDPN